MTDLMTPPAVGTPFKMRSEAAWSGPCPNCKRHVARKRAYKGEQPCTDHRRVRGIEVTWSACEVTDGAIGSLNISYRVTERLSVENPLQGTDGRRWDRGGMTTQAFADGLREGTIILL